jgi:hypothetical protein
VMQDEISKPENIEQLRNELAEHYKDKEFLSCKSMGALVRTSLRMILKHG